MPEQRAFQGNVGRLQEAGETQRTEARGEGTEPLANALSVLPVRHGRVQLISPRPQR